MAGYGKGGWPLATGHVQWLTDSRRDMASSWMSTFRYIDTLTRGLLLPYHFILRFSSGWCIPRCDFSPSWKWSSLPFPASNQPGLVASLSLPRIGQLGAWIWVRFQDQRPKTTDHNIKLQMMRWCPMSTSNMMSYRRNHHHRAFN